MDDQVPVQRIAPPSGGPSVRSVVVTAVVALVVVIAKPWQATPSEGRPSATDPVVRPVAVIEPARASPTPVPEISPAVEADLLRLCPGGGSWRVTAVERWAVQTVRTWLAADVLPASSQLDPRIVFTPVVARAIPSLGFCAPSTGPERPPADASLTVWMLDGGSARRVVVTHRTATPLDPWGALWWPPDTGPGMAGSWQDGRYVVAFASPSTRYARWLGIEVRLLR